MINRANWGVKFERAVWAGASPVPLGTSGGIEQLRWNRWQSFKSERFNPESFLNEAAAKFAGCADFSVSRTLHKPRMAGMQDTSQVASEAAAGVHPWPPGDVPAERLLRLVHWTSAASRQLRRRLAEVAQRFDLSDAELLVVWLCHGNGHVQVELASAIGISPAQMSGLAERLRARGLVGMHRLAMDRRRQVWRTSPTGEALLREVAGHLDELAAVVGGAISPAEQQATETLCERLVEAVGHGGRRSIAGSARTNEQDEQRASKEAA
jgi:DNA-binding MarR family transcriptional regulator